MDIFRVDELCQRSAEEILRFVPKKGAARGGGIEKDSRGIVARNHVAGVFCEKAIPAFTLVQRIPRPLLPCDVLTYPCDPVNLPVPITHRKRARPDPPERRVGTNDSEFDPMFVKLAAAGAVVQFINAFTIFGMHRREPGVQSGCQL